VETYGGIKDTRNALRRQRSQVRILSGAPIISTD
jgi:hypothetical protein